MQKYKSKKVAIDNIRFDSKLEGDYYRYLRDNNNVKSFELQPRFILQDKCEKNWEKLQPVYYIADFLVENKDWTKYIVDIKGMATEASKLKRKLFIYKYDMPLKRIVRYKWERVDYFENRKRQLKNKKDKKT